MALLDAAFSQTTAPTGLGNLTVWADTLRFIYNYRAALPPGHERMANLVNLMVPTINALTRATEFALAFVCLLLNRCC